MEKEGGKEEGEEGGNIFYWYCLDHLLPFEQFSLIVRKLKSHSFWKPMPLSLRRESRLRKRLCIYFHIPVIGQLPWSGRTCLNCAGSLCFSLDSFITHSYSLPFCCCV